MGRIVDDDSKLMEGFILGTFEGLLMLTDPHFSSAGAPSFSVVKPNPRPVNNKKANV
jgi:hypothetical protein